MSHTEFASGTIVNPVGEPKSRQTENLHLEQEAFGTTEWGLTAGIALIWGASFFFIDIGLRAFHPGLIACLRLLLGTVALAFFRKARKPVKKSDLGRIALLGLTWMAIPLILFPLAQQWVDSSVAGMIDGAVPLTATAFSILMFRRLPGRRQIWGLLLGFFGILAISWPELQGADSSALGVGLLVLAVLFYGIANNIAVPLQKKYGALPVIFRAQLMSLIIVLPYGVWGLPSSQWDLTAFLAMLPLGVLGTGLAYVLMTQLIGRAGAARGSLAIYFVPVVSMLLGAFILHEEIKLIAIVGTALVLMGAWLTSRRDG